MEEIRAQVDHLDLFVMKIKYFYLIRPANYPDYPEDPTPGKGSVIFKKGDVKIGVINVQGRLFLESIDCPFRSADKLVEEAAG